jgi:molecular chaperone HtpG
MNTNLQEEKLSFQAEVKQLLHIVTHSLYSNKEIFLRELIANASDAADKLRFNALSNDALYEGDSKLWIKVLFDKNARTITVRDNGIGMSREEVIANLGTIAKSHTKEFLESLTKDKAKDTNLIGQFGVGFYSSFVVAKKVIVNTRGAGKSPKQGVRWESTADGEYIIKNIEQTWRGTEVILHLKPEEDEFLDDWKLRSIIKKYSDHILLPIYMQKQVDIEKDKKDKKDEKGIKDVSVVEEVVNRATALWTLPKKDIKEEDYKELYKHITHDFNVPLLWSHNVIEGKLEYISLLYIPEHAPFDMGNREQRHGLKLYVQRIFVMDDAEQLLPNYLRFVRGIVDSKDLPLNISREILQNNRIIDNIKGGIVKRILDILEKLAQNDKDKYTKFWNAFGQVLKEGIMEDHANKDRIAKLLRFVTMHDSNGDKKGNISLDEYISRMKPKQEKLYYITADSITAAMNSPHLEIFKQKGIEVLLFVNRIDEWMVSNLHEYAGKKLQSVTKGDIDLSEIQPTKDKAVDKKDKKSEEDKSSKEELGSIIKKMQTVLADKVKEVRLSKRLTDSPTCLVTGENEMSMHLQNIMMASGQSTPRGKPTLEVNPKHQLVLQLKQEKDEQKFANWTNLLFEQALLTEGGRLDDPASFVKRFNSMLLENIKK